MTGAHPWLSLGIIVGVGRITDHELELQPESSAEPDSQKDALRGLALDTGC